MLTREEIIERLRGLKSFCLEFYDEELGFTDSGAGDYYRRDDILAIIKEAESE